MNTIERNNKIDRISTKLKLISSKKSIKITLFLKRFEGEKLDILISKWLDYYYKRQRQHNDKEKFRIYLKSQIEIYINDIKSDIVKVEQNIEYDDGLLIERQYHELIYDGQHDPWIALLENEKKLEKKDRVKTLVSSVSKSLYNLFDRK